jgi:hypothetical protein
MRSSTGHFSILPHGNFRSLAADGTSALLPSRQTTANNLKATPMTNMNRRAFVRRTVGRVAAATLLSPLALSADASTEPAVTSAGTQPRLTGSFFDLAHPNLWDCAYWTDTCRFWKEENWRALMQDMHGVGIDTAILINSALWGRPLFPGYEKTVGLPLRFACHDPLGACVDEADKLGMKMFFGVGFRGRCSQVRDYAGMEKPWPDVWFEWNRALATALVERYGSRPCFAGLYIAYEIDFNDLEIELYERLVRKYLRPAIGKVKLLASPGNLGVDMPGRKIEKLPKLMERTNIDILAPQDYGGRDGNVAKALAIVARQVEPLKKMRKPLADIGVTLWANCELFSKEQNPDGRGRTIAGPFERIKRQMEMQAPCVEKLICYAYAGMMNRHTKLVNIGHPSTQKLYDQYVAYVNERFK